MFLWIIRQICVCFYFDGMKGTKLVHDDMVCNPTSRLFSSYGGGEGTGPPREDCTCTVNRSESGVVPLLRHTSQLSLFVLPSEIFTLYNFQMLKQVQHTFKPHNTLTSLLPLSNKVSPVSNDVITKGNNTFVIFYVDDKRMVFG